MSDGPGSAVGAGRRVKPPRTSARAAAAQTAIRRKGRPQPLDTAAAALRVLSGMGLSQLCGSMREEPACSAVRRRASKRTRSFSPVGTWMASVSFW